MINLAVAVTALIASVGAAFWAGRVDARLNNGLSENVRNIRQDVGRIFQRLDSLACATHEEQIKHCETFIQRHEA